MIPYIIMELNVRKIELELERMGWSMAELARQMGAHRQLVHRFMTKKENGLTFKTVERIADALGIPAKDLIK